MRRLLNGLVLTGFLLAPLSGEANLALSEVERARDAHAFVRTVMSPFCPGRTLTDCPSPDAAALREEIRQRLDAGVSEDAIRLDLERRYGDAVVAEPRSVWAWAFPILFLAAGLGALIATLRSLSRRGPAAPPPAPELARELDADLDSHGL